MKIFRKLLTVMFFLGALLPAAVNAGDFDADGRITGAVDRLIGINRQRVIENVDPDTVGLPKRFVIDLEKRTMRGTPDSLVRRVVSDIVAQYKELLRLQRQRNALLKSGRKAAALGVKRQGTAIAERIDELIGELRGIGCDLKDLEGGLVDFPGRRKGQGILLCWKPSEPNVMFWHEVHAGFSGRRPIDAACE